MTDMLTVGLIQLTVSDDQAVNLPATQAMIRQAASKGARLILTPEATNLLSPDRAYQARALYAEHDDPTLTALREQARDLGIWLLIGSLALKTGDPDGRFANRSFLIDPQGQITARYDKLHMFDVDLDGGQSFRESAAYRPGDQAVLSYVYDIPVGLTICYDLRFPHLYRALAKAGAQILTVPSAFHPQTGAAHWETLLRARAIETGCFVLAPAQCGTHPNLHSPDRPSRTSFGQSLIIDPWGQVLADGGSQSGITVASLDLTAVNKARSRIPSLTHDRPFAAPQGHTE